MKLESVLSRGLAAMGVSLPAAPQAQLLAFLRLLEKWNRAYNLTAVRDVEQMVPRHLLDSLSVLPYLKGVRAIDIGTGAGLPGLPLALARPDMQFVLLDGNAKKTRFVTQAVHELGLTNVEVVQSPVEDYHPDRLFDTLIARALAAIPDMLNSSRHLYAPQGQLLAMKGVFPQEEIAAVGEGFRVREVVQLAVPGLDAARHLVILEPA
jgi:16S rRNA (guanine527-N7)-methyltransferase